MSCALIRQEEIKGPTSRAFTKSELQDPSPGHPGRVRSSRVPFPLIFSSSAGPAEPWEANFKLTNYLQ